MILETNYSKRIDILVLLTLSACLFTMVDNALIDSTIFKIAALGSDVLVIIWAIYQLGVANLSSIFANNRWLLALILVANFLISPYEPRYPLLLKIFGYAALFTVGFQIGSNGFYLECRKSLLYVTIFLPLIVVALFDKTPNKTQFFANSNMFTFWGISMSILWLLCNEHSRKNIIIAWLILAGYIFTGTSLGIMLAIMISFFLLNLKRINPVILLALITLMISAIIFVDIPVFERLRDSFRIFQSLSLDDFIHPENVNFFELQDTNNASGRTDNASFLWRIMQWSTILGYFITQPLYWIFGLGADWAMYKTSKPPHNDYVMVLSEYGIIIFYSIVRKLKELYSVLKYNNIIYFIFPIFIYHFTENLLDTFPPNIFFYLSIGFYYASIIINDPYSYQDNGVE